MAGSKSDVLSMTRRDSPTLRILSAVVYIYQSTICSVLDQLLCEPRSDEPHDTIMTVYTLPLFLEDKTGSITSGSEFVDIHDRLRLLYKRTSNSRDLYMVYNLSSTTPSSPYNMALMALDFGLHTITFDSGMRVLPMKKWCSKSSSGRKFTASDAQEYLWAWRVQEGQEWTCTNTNGYLVAYYSLKSPGEPNYEGSSGCTLTVDEAFSHLAPEYLASLMIVRWSKERGGI